MRFWDRFRGGPTEDDAQGRYPLGYISFNVFPREYDDENVRRETSIWNSLFRPRRTDDEPSDIQRLEQMFQTRLRERLGKPVEVRIAARLGTIVLEAAFFLGAYALIKDYKDFRDSVTLLKQDVRRGLDLPADWRVEADVHTPEPLALERGDVGIGMDIVSRYAFLYLMITNILLMVIFGYIVWSIVIQST